MNSLVTTELKTNDVDQKLFEQPFEDIKKLIWFNMIEHHKENTNYQKELIRKYSQLYFQAYTDLNSFDASLKNLDKRSILIVFDYDFEKIYPIAKLNEKIKFIICFVRNRQDNMDKLRNEKVFEIVETFENLTKKIDEILIVNRSLSSTKKTNEFTTETISSQEVNEKDYFAAYSTHKIRVLEDLKNSIVRDVLEDEEKKLIKMKSEIDFKTDIAKDISDHVGEFKRKFLNNTKVSFTFLNILNQLFDTLVELNTKVLEKEETNVKEELKKPHKSRSFQIDEIIEKERTSNSQELKLNFEKVRMCANKFINNRFKIEGIIWFDKLPSIDLQAPFVQMLRSRCPELEVQMFSEIFELISYLDEDIDKRMIVITTDFQSLSELYTNCWNQIFITNILYFEHQSIELYRNLDPGLSDVIDKIASIDLPKIDWLLPKSVRDTRKIERLDDFLNKETMINKLNYVAIRDIAKKYGYDENSIISDTQRLIFESLSQNKKETTTTDIKDNSKQILQLFSSKLPIYHLLNRLLSNLDKNEISQFYNLIKTVENALIKYDDGVYYEQITLYKGIYYKGDFKEILKKYEIGLRTVFPTFLSCLSDKDAAYDFDSGILFEIQYKIKNPMYRPKRIELTGENIFQPFTTFIIEEIKNYPNQKNPYHNYYEIVLENLE